MPVSNANSGHVPRRRDWQRTRSVVRWLRNGFAFLGVAVTLLFLGALLSNLREMKDYQERLEALTDSTKGSDGNVIPPNHIVSVSEQQTPVAIVENHMTEFQRVVDSLELADNTRGFSLVIRVLPIGVSGYRECRSRLDILSGCDCNSRQYDLYSLELDPVQSTAKVEIVERLITLAQYETLYRRISGIRR